METSLKFNLNRSLFFLLLSGLILCLNPVYGQTTTYAPGSHSVVVPAGVTTMQVTVTGAAGGSFGAAAGGKGGQVIATYAVTPGTTYYIFVGDKAANSSGSNGGSSYGGGEDGGKGGTGGSSTGIGGGAASDVRTSITGGSSSTASLNSRIVVGGGGGGAGAQGCTGNSAGGNGGYPAGTAGATGGCTSCTPAGGGGGTQTAGGARGGSASCSTAQPGAFGNGGTGGATTSGVPPAGGTGAGGGGWYGGGGSYSGGGGGGSSYASSTNLIGTATFNNGVNTGDGEVIICFSPSAITGPSTVCPGGTIALTDITPGGTWTSGTPGVATVESTTGIVHGISGGTTVISYSTGTCPAVMTVTVSNLGAITGTTTVCQGSNTYLSSTTPGGVWSSDNTSVATVAGGIVGGVSTGTANISYTVGSCAVGTAVTVSGSVAAITGPSAVCGGATIALTDITAGGTWSSSNTAIATVSSTGIVTGGATSGTATISYTSGACVATQPVTVTAVAPVTGPATTVCAGSTITLSSASPGGAWSSDNTTVATVSGTAVTGAGAGTANISYTIGSCSSSIMVTVTAGLSAISGPSSVCTGSTVTLSNTTPGGTWSSSNTSRATIDASTGVVYGVAAGTTNISYSVGGCSTGTVITVGILPAITGPSSVCPGATITLSNATTGGTWSSVSTSIATVDPATGVVTGVAPGTTSISYTNGTCSVGIAITVGPLPAITGVPNVCPGSTTSLSNTTSGGVWSSDNTSVATVSATGVVYGVAAGTANISYTTGPCAVGLSVTVGILPAITGPNTVCPGGNITLNNTTAGGTWSSSSTAIATVDAAGVVYGVAAGSATITYTSGTCFVTKAVTVGALSAITGSTTLCAGSTTTLSHATTGGTWSSGSTAIATVDPVTGVVYGVSAGSVSITYHVGSCSVNISLTVNSALSAISGPTTVCVGSTIALSNATGGGVWSSDNTAVATVTASGVVSGVSNGTANISYTVGTCSVGIAITVNTLPAITGPNSVCAGSTITLNNAVPGGVWSSGSTGAATVDPSTGVVTGVASGSSTIVYTVSGCTTSLLVTVGSAVSAITGPNTVCTGSTIKLSDASTGGAWSSDNTSIATINTSGVVSGVAAGSATISYTVGGCAATLAITVVANSAGTISGPDSVCKGISHQVTLTSTVSGGTWSSSNTARATVDPVTGVVTGAQSGSVTIKYVVSNSCGTFTVTHVMYVRSPSRCALAVQASVSQADNGLRIFPNPNSGAFTAQLVSDIEEDVHIVVTNIVGEKIKEYTTTTNTALDIKLDTSPGIYLISASTAHERFVTKVIVR